MLPSTINVYFLTIPLLKKKEPRNQTFPPKRIDNHTLCNKELSHFQQKVNKFFMELPLDSAIHLPPSELIDNFEKITVKVAKELAPSDHRK
jgi:hypothetical protein